MCANIEIFDKKVLLFGTIEEKDDFLDMEKEKKDIKLSIKLNRKFYDYLSKRASNKNIKFMPSRELYELAMKGMELELNSFDFKKEVSEKLDERSKKALELFDKAEELIKEEGV